MANPKPQAQSEHKRPDARLSGQELSALISHLQSKGLRGQDLSSIIVANMTRRQAAVALARYLQTLPKAES